MGDSLWTDKPGSGWQATYRGVLPPVMTFCGWEYKCMHGSFPLWMHMVAGKNVIPR